MAVANIVLKDGNGADVTYSKVNHIKAKEDSGEERIYTDMSILSAYYGTYNEATSTYTIAGQWFASKGAGYAIAGSNGDYSIILTSKKLTTGVSYSLSEIGGV